MLQCLRIHNKFELATEDTSYCTTLYSTCKLHLTNPVDQPGELVFFHKFVRPSVNLYSRSRGSSARR